MSSSFGSYDDRSIRLFTLRNDRIRARITDYGGALVSLETPDRTGRRGHVVLGFDDIAGYVGSEGRFGAILGRCANRIADGAIDIDGRRYRLAKNEPDATLHGGPMGFDRRVWSLQSIEPQRLSLALTSPDGDQGFPGEATVTATYALEEDALHLVLEGVTTAPTPLSLSAHPYFNLDSRPAIDCLEHQMEIVAPHFLPTDERQIPTGEIADVIGTPFDFREPRAIGARIHDADPQLSLARGYDHYFILPVADADGPRLAACVQSHESGRRLEVLTTHRGLQFYSGNKLDGSDTGRSGAYRRWAGFALEPHGFPNAPNQPDFPSTILRPGEAYREEIVYRFSISG